MFKLNKSKPLVGALVFLSAGVFLNSCSILPEKPGKNVVYKKKSVGKHMTLNKMRYKGYRYHKRNLLFAVGLGDEVHEMIGPMLKKVYKKETYFDDVVWWKMAPRIPKIYQKVLRIDPRHLTKAHILKAMDYLEDRGRRKGEQFDVVIMTHGEPDSEDHAPSPQLAAEDLKKLKGKFKHLNLVIAQGGVDLTEIKKWHHVGAKAVMAYEEFSLNFVYFEYFFKHYSNHPKDLGWAYRDSLRNYHLDLGRSMVTSAIIKEIGYNGVDDFLRDPENKPPEMLWHPSLIEEEGQ